VRLLRHVTLEGDPKQLRGHWPPKPPALGDAPAQPGRPSMLLYAPLGLEGPSERSEARFE